MYYIKIIILKIGLIKEKLPLKKLRRKNPRGGRSAPPSGHLGLKTIDRHWYNFLKAFFVNLENHGRNLKAVTST